MDIKRILYFKRVAETQHITKAAQDLYVSQAHLSRIIGEMERELGVELFDREGRGLVLNECGKIFYEYALKMISLFNEATQRTQEAHLRAQFQVAVATNSSAYMPAFLSKTSKKHANMKIRQYSGPRKKVVAMLKNGSVDFAITAPPLDEIGINSVQLRNEIPAIIYPKGHWLEDYDVVSLEKILNEPFVGVAQGFGARDTIDAYYQTHGLSPTFVLETGDTISVERYVEQGLGIALCARALVLQEDHFKNHHTLLEEDVPCILGLSWNSNRALSKEGEAFYREAVEYFSDLANLDG
ncbi:MAG: LysR family transcriptional regulator [Gordonibacter sp.]|uniref:LysR family transcriptional regulator n=1 Tax=Gordonibacter sp. TaxID=1968902 RepID=UPI002FCA482E